MSTFVKYAYASSYFWSNISMETGLYNIFRLAIVMEMVYPHFRNIWASFIRNAIMGSLKLPSSCYPSKIQWKWIWDQLLKLFSLEQINQDIHKYHYSKWWLDWKFKISEIRGRTYRAITLNYVIIWTTSECFIIAIKIELFPSSCKKLGTS